MDFLCVPVGCFAIDRRVTQVLPFTTWELITREGKADSATVHLSLLLLFQTAPVDLTDWRQAHLNQTECLCPTESVTETKHACIIGLLFTLTWQT